MAKMGASNASAGRATMRGVRLMEAKCATIEKMAIERGFSSASAFIRAAIDHELEGAGREAKMNEAENPIAASLERHSRDLFRLSRALQALFAVVDTLIKTFLTCVPEPPGEAKPQAVARAKERYDRFVKSGGQAMAGESSVTMQDLVNRGEE
jgi:Arc/MetJ-type ribon-helix-helix transcriptional regulator